MTSHEDLSIGRVTIIRLTMYQAIIFLAIALTYALLVGDISSIGITGGNWALSVAWGIILFIMVMPLLYLPKRLGIRNQLEEVLATKLRVKDILALNLLVSCSEELFFRGFLLRLVGVIPSALVFGAMHYIGYASLLEVAYALGTGLLLGYLYKFHIPNILFPITFHYLANAFSLLLTRGPVPDTGRKGFETEAQESESPE